MKSFKEIMIHLMGGYTECECREFFAIGRMSVNIQYKNLAESFYGCGTLEFCKAIYKAIAENYQQDSKKDVVSWPELVNDRIKDE